MRLLAALLLFVSPLVSVASDTQHADYPFVSFPAGIQNSTTSEFLEFLHRANLGESISETKFYKDISDLLALRGGLYVQIEQHGYQTASVGIVSRSRTSAHEFCIRLTRYRARSATATAAQCGTGSDDAADRFVNCYTNPKLYFESGVVDLVCNSTLEKILAELDWFVSVQLDLRTKLTMNKLGDR